MPVASAWTQTRIGSLDTVTCRLDEFAGPYNSPFLPIKRFLAIQGSRQYFSTLLHEGLEGHKELAQFEAMERGAQMRKARVVKSLDMGTSIDSLPSKSQGIGGAFVRRRAPNEDLHGRTAGTVQSIPGSPYRK